MASDPYLYPGTKTLINNFEVKDPDKLSVLENKIFHIAFLQPLPLGNFDLEHLRHIHKHFFEKVYPWAGEIRIIDIAKENSYFAHHAFIEPYADKIFSKLKHEDFSDPLTVPEKLAKYFNEINAIHPFREGNGRTQRAFISKFAQSKNYVLSWENVANNAYLQASIEGFKGNDKPMVDVFKEALQPIKINQYQEIKTQQNNVKAIADKLNQIER